MLARKKFYLLFGDFNLTGEQISAILVTHEHIDHTKSLATLSNKFNIPVYANKKTWNALSNIKIKNENKNFFNTLENFEINDIKIFPFPTPHDAEEPCRI